MTTENTTTTAPFDHASDPGVRKIIDIIDEAFTDLDDP